MKHDINFSPRFYLNYEINFIRKKFRGGQDRNLCHQVLGIFWNKVLDSNKFLYGDYQIFSAVIFFFIFKAFIYSNRFYRFFESKEKFKHVFLINKKAFLNLILWRYMSGITILDIFCGFVWFNNDWVF